MKSYCKPFKRGVSWRSQNFGESSTIYGPHSGNDEAANTGTKVHAAGNGVVIHAGTFDATYADNLLWLMNMGGNVLVLDCGDDEPTFVYAHLDKFHVTKGDTVTIGQVIADSGNTGTATTGAHLHVEALPPGYNLQGYLLGRVNPDIYLTEWPEDLSTIQLQSSTVEEDDMYTQEDRDNDTEVRLNLRKVVPVLPMIVDMLDNMSAAINSGKPIDEEAMLNIRKLVKHTIDGE